ncbi:MAG: quinone-dependent dihydroorotate dehydrogenase [Pseudomonadota bacterium]
MKFAETLGLAALRQLDPETAHGLALRALNAGLVTHRGPVRSQRLAMRLAGLDFANPLGLAAGFDKNADALAPLCRVGFGFLEVGAATPRPQPGNPRPRLFRLSEDRAAINRFGFNNAGASAIAERLADRPQNGVPIGLNLGANKDSTDRAQDFAEVLRICGPCIDFATVNVSSPNTERLRDLQGADALRALLDGVLEVRDGLEHRVPVFLKIAPDMDDEALADIARVAMDAGLDAVVATNTTLGRDGLKSRYASETGGLSGAPLFEPSTRVLARLAALTGGEMPLIGVGGVGSAEDAYAKIRAGAAAVQLYTALVYRGVSLVGEIVRGLDDLVTSDGFDSVVQAVGTDRATWL